MLETGENKMERDCLGSAKASAVWVHRTVRWCTGQCPVCQAGSGELGALGNKLTAYDYNSPDYPVCTGLSGAPTVGQANGRLRDLRETRGRANGRKGHRTVRCAPDMSGAPTAPRSATIGRAILGRKSGTGQCPVCTGLSGAPGGRRQDLPSRNALNGS